jgi:hypothetical protein
MVKLTHSMSENLILEELGRVKDALAAESGYDIERFIEGLLRWEAEHPFPGRVVDGAEELRQLVAEEERKRSKAPGSILKDDPRRSD